LIIWHLHLIETLDSERNGEYRLPDLDNLKVVAAVVVGTGVVVGTVEAVSGIVKAWMVVKNIYFKSDLWYTTINKKMYLQKRENIKGQSNQRSIHSLI